MKKIFIILAIGTTLTSCGLDSGNNNLKATNWPTNYSSPVYTDTNDVPGEVTLRQGHAVSLTTDSLGYATMQFEFGGMKNVTHQTKNNGISNTYKLTLRNPPAYAVKLYRTGSKNVNLFFNRAGNPKALVWSDGIRDVRWNKNKPNSTRYSASGGQVRGNFLPSDQPLPLWAEDSHKGIHPLVITRFHSISIPKIVRANFGGSSELSPAWVYGSYANVKKAEARLNDGGLDLITIKRREQDFFTGATMSYVILPDGSDGLVHEYHTYPF